MAGADRGDEGTVQHMAHPRSIDFIRRSSGREVAESPGSRRRSIAMTDNERIAAGASRVRCADALYSATSALACVFYSLSVLFCFNEWSTGRLQH